MQWLSNLPLGDNRAVQAALLGGTALILLTALVVLYRTIFGHRLRFSAAGKARQPRLGLVDAFSLDGQRQLVIVRRDNVEHLLMIGGPNDVVVESQIVRAQAQVQPQPRDKDGAGLAVAPAPPKPSPPAPPPPTKAAPPPTVAPAGPPPRPAAIPAAARAPARTEAAPAAHPKPPAAAARQPQPPPPAAGGAPRALQGADQGQAGRPALRPSVLPLRPANPLPVRSPSLPPPIVVGGQGGPPAPPRAGVTPMTSAAPARKEPAPPQAAAEAKPDPFGGLESLEAEMARLLGRDP